MNIPKGKKKERGMNMNIIEKLRKNDGGIYDFVASEWHNFTKEELKDLLLELNYATYKKINADLLNEIENEAVCEFAEKSNYQYWYF